MNELVLIKYGVGMGLAIYVIKQLFVLVGVLTKAGKMPEENQIRDSSREKINETHAVVTAKSEGVPLVYNKGLEKAVDRLNITMNTLAISIKTLADKSI